ncbi:hypothetical protein ACUY3S_09995 [Corynebacterium resistens]
MTELAFEDAGIAKALDSGLRNGVRLATALLDGRGLGLGMRIDHKM